MFYEKKTFYVKRNTFLSYLSNEERRQLYDQVLRNSGLEGIADVYMDEHDYGESIQRKVG